MSVHLSKPQKQVAILYSATVLGTLIGVCNSVINTHFLDPEDYGDVRYVQNIIALLSTLLLFGYFVSGSRLLAISKSEKRSRRIRGTMCMLLIGLNLIIMLILALCYLFHDLVNPFDAKYLFLVSIPFCGSILMLNYINTVAQGDNQINRIAIARFMPSFLYLLAALFIYNKYGATSTIFILLQQGIACFVLISIILSTRLSLKETRHTFAMLTNENKQYGKHLYYGSIAMCATQYIPGITLSFFHENNVLVGFFTLALTVTTPLQLLPSIIGTTYFKRFATESSIPPKVMKVTVVMTTISCLIFIVSIYPLIKWLYSPTYSSVGIYAAALSLCFGIHGIGDMINRYLGSHGQGKPIKKSSYYCGIVSVIGYTLGVYIGGIYGALLTKVLSSSVYSITLYIYYLDFIEKCKNETKLCDIRDSGRLL